MWLVRCDGYRDVWVIADDWTHATMVAANTWAVAWRKIAAYCALLGKKERHPNVCANCGKVFNASGLLCSNCFEKQLEGKDGDSLYSGVEKRPATA